jgi:hypothetical protein
MGSGGYCASYINTRRYPPNPGARQSQTSMGLQVLNCSPITDLLRIFEQDTCDKGALSEEFGSPITQVLKQGSCEILSAELGGILVTGRLLL